jgi:hypothetical protein
MMRPSKAPKIQVWVNGVPGVASSGVLVSIR